jgi:hypothetical protein
LHEFGAPSVRYCDRMGYGVFVFYLVKGEGGKWRRQRWRRSPRRWSGCDWCPAPPAS